MNGQPEVTIPYWFWQSFGLIVLAISGQILYKWMDWKFFQKEDKWAGGERRQTVEIDEVLVKTFIDTYRKHVDYVGALSINLQASTETMKALTHEVRQHRESEEENYRLIRDIHRRLPDAG